LLVEVAALAITLVGVGLVGIELLFPDKPLVEAPVQRRKYLFLPDLTQW